MRFSCDVTVQMVPLEKPRHSGDGPHIKIRSRAAKCVFFAVQPCVLPTVITVVVPRRIDP
jgi:hypothetical protein